MDERTSVSLIQALAAVWSEIRHHHPDVPGVVLLAAPAAGKRILGHFAALRWSVRKKAGDFMHEVVVSAEYLDRDPEDIIETLVHEAAHAINFARGIRDCSKSQYHNKHFKLAAEELGLEVLQMEHYGWAYTTMTEATEIRYAEVATSLALVLVHRRSNFAPATPPSGGDMATTDDQSVSRNRKAVCPCGFIIRMSKKTAAETTVRCDQCGNAFGFA